MTTPTIIYLTEIDRAREHGLPWTSENAARWDYRQRHERGTAEAFVRIGRRVGVYVDRYHNALRARTAS
jgi:hypothetical protein